MQSFTQLYFGSLSDRHSLQFSGILPDIQADLNTAVVWIVSRAPTIVGITVTYIFQSF